MAAAKKRAPVCIVYTGQSGTGKSTLIGTLDGFTKGKAGAKSDTVGSHMSADSVTGDKLMDTQGVMDSSGKVSDGAITAAVVKAMKDNGVAQVKIVWTIRESRISPALQAVAKFIHSLGEPVGALRDLKDWTPVDIWKSVIIIVAEGTGKKQGFGAIAAAKEAMQNSSYDYAYHGQEKTIPVFCLSILDKLPERSLLRKLADTLDGNARLQAGLLEINEIGEWQRDKISRSVIPSKVVFEDVHCHRCGVEGDPRSMIPECHDSFKHRGEREAVMKSSYRTDRFHVGSLIPVKRPLYRTDRSHKGTLIARVVDTFKTEWYHPGRIGRLCDLRWSTCCGYFDIDDLSEVKGCKSRQIKTGTKLIYEWSGCGHRPETSPCEQTQVQIGEEILNQKWSGCQCREGTTECQSKKVQIGHSLDFYRYNGCQCREGTSVDDCPSSVCKTCNEIKGTHRNPSSKCDGKHEFV